MIGGAKGMIAGCIDRMGRDDCGGCERRDACKELFAGLFGSAMREPRRRPAAEPRPFFRSLLEMLGEVARNVEQTQEARRAAQPERPAAARPDWRRRPAPSARAAPAAEEAEPGPFRRQVEAHLEPMLADGPIGIDSVARALGYSRQTLYRRLKAEGATFEEVLDGLRRRLALRFIREEGLSVKDAAYRLGFSDPAAFSRAFKRWTGSSPKNSKH